MFWSLFWIRSRYRLWQNAVFSAFFLQKSKPIPFAYHDRYWHVRPHKQNNVLKVPQRHNSHSLGCQTINSLSATPLMSLSWNNFANSMIIVNLWTGLNICIAVLSFARYILCYIICKIACCGKDCISREWRTHCSSPWATALVIQFSSGSIPCFPSNTHKCRKLHI